MNKGDQQFDDLLKVPDEAIIKSQQVEIGKLNAYIEELEFKISGSKYKLTESKIVNYVNGIENLQNALSNRKKEIESLICKNKKLEDRINDLMYKNFHGIKF